MFAVMAYFPMEALLDDDMSYGRAEILAVRQTEGEAEYFLALYKASHESACDEWDKFDDLTKDWSAQHDRKLNELQEKYRVVVAIPDMKFEVQEITEGPYQQEGPLPLTMSETSKTNRLR